ncbi:MAG: hypothetical protein GF364_09605 [Candidatus Lokiarchaeota archaeon]|nr:hypothetical protein [Candidatus Lokiarchaeota archaeon]
MGIIGGFPYFIAVELAGVTVVQPLMNFGFIALVLWAKKILNEELTPTAKIAIGLMIIMPLFIALGNVPEPTLNKPSDFYVFIIIAVIVILILFAIAKKVPILWAFGCGMCFALGAANLQAFLLPLDFTAGLDILIDQAIDNILFGILSIFFNGMGVFIGQIGLQKTSASRYNPINQTMNNITSIIGGIIVFAQLPVSPFYYIIGFILGIVGVFLLGKYTLDEAPLQELVEESEIMESTEDDTNDSK